MRSEEWQKEFNHGYYLLLARMAFRRQPIEAAYIQCWTIWEHLFAVLNRTWLSTNQLRSISSIDKIKFLLVKYAIKPEFTEVEHKRINTLADIRNRLVHYGRFPEHRLCLRERSSFYKTHRIYHC